jgi:hypothetical protein
MSVHASTANSSSVFPLAILTVTSLWIISYWYFCFASAGPTTGCYTLHCMRGEVCTFFTRNPFDGLHFNCDIYRLPKDYPRIHLGWDPSPFYDESDHHFLGFSINSADNFFYRRAVVIPLWAPSLPFGLLFLNAWRKNRRRNTSLAFPVAPHMTETPAQAD